MNRFATYNRVRQLEAGWIHPFISGSYFIASSTALVAAAAVLAEMLGLISGLGVIVAAFLWMAAVRFWDQHRHCRCQHCGDKLGFVERELMLTPEYVAMRGIKKGNAFYAQCRWGEKPFTQRWAKISHQARACHHCRVSEEGYYRHYEPVSTDELASLDSNKTTPSDGK